MLSRHRSGTLKKYDLFNIKIRIAKKSAFQTLGIIRVVILNANPNPGRKKRSAATPSGLLRKKKLYKNKVEKETHLYKHEPAVFVASLANQRA